MKCKTWNYNMAQLIWEEIATKKKTELTNDNTNGGKVYCKTTKILHATDSASQPKFSRIW